VPPLDEKALRDDARWYESHVALLIVDARNVLRSEWPNIPEDELVAATRAWADANGHEPLIVFDGDAPAGGVGSGRESADDRITREVAQLDEPYVLVTTDRELRRRAGGGAERVIGGGTFARELRPYPSG
jgi:hypothetical protein